ncbi:MAG TPA: hypothetical protein VJ830_04035 [Anaerolineales bacterium]|nr:hypothetical protein [Anaerolineales bacterium]
MSSKNRLNLHVFCLVALLILVSCTSVPETTSPTSTPPQTQPAATSTAESLIIQAGLRYNDPAGDMEVSFLDMVGLQTTVNEEAELLEVTFQMRDIPETVTRRQIKNQVEYAWEIHVFLDPSKMNTTDAQPDYFLSLMTVQTDPPSGQEILTPEPGEPETVSIDRLWDMRLINNQQGDFLGEPEAFIDSDLDTITLRAHIPGLSSNAGFRIATVYYDGPVMDRPDNAVVSASTNLSTPLPESTQAPQASSPPATNDDMQLIPARAVRAYPGPEHYAGDVLTFEIQTSNGFEETFPVSMSLDDLEPTELQATFTYGFTGVVQIPLALDTTNLSGRHTVKFATADGSLNETYSFDVLPAEQRPANETSAVWIVKETECCIFHYVSETAAARDIDFIAKNFDQAARDFESVMGTEIPSKMDVHILDRIWGNGGFGGGGELVISYTDRYYGPTMGSAGLQTLARHEFSHAANVGVDNAGDGLEFNYEGLAVYVAGGHYKPEPLAQRGAALYDLGHYVPVDQFIPQHELSYLHAAVILTYIDETYGQDKLWQVLSADDDTPDEQFISLGDAIQSTLGISLRDFDQGLQAWLERNEPGEQLDDLRLTIELQDLRRQYQDTYSPPPNILFGQAADGVARPELLPVVMREARAPSNIAIELMIGNAQRAIIAGAYSEAEELIKSIKEVVTTGDFEDPLAKEYFEIVVTAADAGYEVLTLNIQNSHGTAQVTNNPPETTVLEVQKLNGIWQVQP